LNCPRRTHRQKAARKKIHHVSKRNPLPDRLTDDDKKVLADSIANLNTAHADITKSAPKPGSAA
jgi:hypothetical protein